MAFNHSSRCDNIRSKSEGKSNAENRLFPMAGARANPIRQQKVLSDKKVRAPGQNNDAHSELRRHPDAKSAITNPPLLRPSATLLRNINRPAAAGLRSYVTHAQPNPGVLRFLQRVIDRRPQGIQVPRTARKPVMLHHPLRPASDSGQPKSDQRRSALSIAAREIDSSNIFMNHEFPPDEAAIPTLPAAAAK